MIPTALAVALTLLHPSELDLKVLVKWKPTECTAIELLAEKWRVEAVDLRNANRPAEALPLFNAALLLRPTNYALRVGRAKTFAALGRWDEQADDYAVVAAVNPNHPTAWQDVAAGWIARGRWAEAEVCFQRALELCGPGDQRRQMLLQEAFGWLGWAVSPPAGYKLTTNTFSSLPPGQLMLAESALTDALATKGEGNALHDRRLHALRGIVRHTLGRLGDAAEDYKAMLAISAADGEAHFMLARVAFELKEYSQAMENLNAAKSGGFDLAEVARARCITVLAAGMDSEVRSRADEWIQHAPDSTEAPLYRAVALRVIGQDDAADHETQRGAALNKRTFFQQAWAEMLALWNWYQRFDAADRLLTRLLDTPLSCFDRAIVYGMRADLRRQRGVPEDGFDDLTAAVRLSLGCWHDARKRRAEIALQLRHYNIALEDASVLTRLTPADPDAYRLLASARSGIQMAAAVAGRKPDYRPVGPVVYPDIDRDPARRLVIDNLPNR